ncbi:MAG: triose-phosphate isomerase [Patescibacteria group bacterium]|nr:triose-phosphate isomerase [Patescibacteria group bacterium]
MAKNKIIIANWKMKLTLAESLEKAKKFKEKFKGFSRGEVVVCPPFIVLDEIGRLFKKTGLKLGAQDVFFEESGAYTVKFRRKCSLKPAANMLLSATANAAASS